MPVLPFSGGWEDWPLEETTAFEIIEDLVKDEERRKDFLDSMRQKGPTIFKGR